MKRRAMKRSSSNKHFKKNTGIHKVNAMNPRRFRGGIRL